MEESLNDYGNEEILEFYDMLIDNENVTKHDWVLGGTGNGGLASFNFLEVYPDLFEGVVVMPGAFSNQRQIPKEWSKIKMVLAYGENDIGWNTMAKESYSRLSKKVKNIDLFEMKGVGHTITPEYDIDEVYKIYFTK